MIKKINIYDALKKDSICFIDVRSPMEFNKDTVPGAINLPILDNQERETVGYIYTQINKEKAKEMGLEYASKKLPLYYKKIKELQQNNKEIALFCYRGGMRSNSLAKVLDIMGINVYVIDGGYKSYRKYVIDSIDKYSKKIKCIVLHGYTGVGKTKILVKLKKEGHSVLDLEYLARNSGSVFGNIVFNNQFISQKKFESSIVEELKDAPSKYIFIESESKRIGNCIVPDPIFEKMESGFHILINTNMENRIKNIIEDYVYVEDNCRDEALINSIDKLRKRIGNSICDGLINKIQLNDYKYVCEKLMVEYYDPLYQYSIDKISKYDKIIMYKNLDDAVKNLIEFENKLL
ncbi:tRNA 2-selenouridine(34) synthase MnmH [Clostridiisalibacter paucivorans]|uniref:tRNA 2-selenouridine(34) synthase MnmH n=1 Tax=Clostridiisalibacter paucivorans TaxID=408753 RepID=UPI00054DE10C|nr:tRNA 2-selenouridine(34) synthase MnmH [Clostridiisalibacter paucivorans]